MIDDRLYAKLHEYSTGTTQDLITYRPATQCEHNATDKKGLCIKCGYNTLHRTLAELKGEK